MCIVGRITFETLIKEVKHTYGSGFAKMYRDMPEGEFVENVTEEMERWMFLKKEDDMHQIKICPLTGKIQGSYPQDYMGEQKMNSRWQANKIGLINFWYYDEQEFPFSKRTYITPWI